MARKRTHAYIDISVNPKQLATLRAGKVIHKQLKGYDSRIAIRIKDPLDAKIKKLRSSLARLERQKKMSKKISKYWASDCILGNA